MTGKKKKKDKRKETWRKRKAASTGMVSELRGFLRSTTRMVVSPLPCTVTTPAAFTVITLPSAESQLYSPLPPLAQSAASSEQTVQRRQR